MRIKGLSLCRRSFLRLLLPDRALRKKELRQSQYSRKSNDAA